MNMLKPCADCRKEISTDASTCPHCGKPNPTAYRPNAAAASPASPQPRDEPARSKNGVGKISLVIAGLVVAGFSFWLMEDDGAEGRRQAAQKMTPAQAQEAQQARMAAEATAVQAAADNSSKQRARDDCRALIRRKFPTADFPIFGRDVVAAAGQYIWASYFDTRAGRKMFTCLWSTSNGASLSWKAEQ